MKCRWIAALALIVTACSGLEKIESRVDTLESRVTALEKQVEALNKNVAGTAALMEAGTIRSATEKDGVWTLVLSDDRVITLTAGSVGVGATPVMSVDKDGYWMVDYGSGAQYVLSGGEKVMAKGADGVTPVFGVNAAGNWTVSYDGGKTVTEVLGADGKPVSALPGSGAGGDSYFSDVRYEGGVFTLVLKNGTVLEVPVVAGLRCAIAGAESLQVFAKGETKTFAVTLEGVAETVLTAPQGWTASLSETILSVTAPLTTKATLADSRTDVSILALSASGYAAVAKVKVALDDAPAPVSPTAAITAGEAGETTLSFTVTLSDASSWKYLVRKASEAAPSAEFVNENGTPGEGTGATVTSLEESTEYTIYVLPLNGSVLGSLARLNMTTQAAVITDFYAAYQAGKDVVIGGVTYNKKTHGEAVLVKAEAEGTDLKPSIQTKSAVVFLEQTEGASFDIPAVTTISGDIVLLSRYADKPATVRPTVFIKLVSGSLVMKNLVFDAVNIAGGTNATYVFNNANATADFQNWYIEDCRFLNLQKPVLYAGALTYGFCHLTVRNCVFQLVHQSGNLQLFNFYNCSVLHTYKELTFENNVVFNASCVAAQIFNYGQNTAQDATKTWECPLTVKNNIFYNCPSGNGYFKFYQLSSLKINGNVFWADPESTLASYTFILYSANQDATVIDASGNIAYGLVDGKNWALAHSNSTVKASPNTVSKLDENPFTSFDSATGAYVLKAAYSSYGPVR